MKNGRFKILKESENSKVILDLERVGEEDRFEAICLGEKRLYSSPDNVWSVKDTARRVEYSIGRSRTIMGKPYYMATHVSEEDAKHIVSALNDQELMNGEYDDDPYFNQEEAEGKDD